MRRDALFALFVVLALLFSFPAYGADGPYVSISIGMGTADDSDLTDSTLPGTAIDLAYETGYVFGSALGYQFGSFGFEGEIAYRKNDLDKISLMGETTSITGDASALSLLANGYYRLDLGKVPLTPYIGAGLGFAQVKINNFGVPGSGRLDWSDDDIVFSYQISAGMEYDLSKRFAVGVTYRYCGSSDPQFNTTDASFSSHNIILTIKRFF